MMCIYRLCFTFLQVRERAHLVFTGLECCEIGFFVANTWFINFLMEELGELFLKIDTTVIHFIFKVILEELQNYLIWKVLTRYKLDFPKKKSDVFEFVTCACLKGTTFLVGSHTECYGNYPLFCFFKQLKGQKNVQCCQDQHNPF